MMMSRACEPVETKEKAAEEGGTQRGRIQLGLGEGGKATLVGAPDADILLEAIEELQKRTTQEQRRFWSR